ncbi:MAG: 16S rRNA pseudouridine(516) synthase RsuA [Psychrosphaera sp.]|nr:16S rRNA pseudouridine(516) synthase RsuA [Psychrosphaera sp.]
MRLDKFICGCTDYSRINAKRAIGKGNVTVNGELVKNPATKIKDTDQVHLGEQLLSFITERYIMLNKPVDFICSNVDESHPSVLNLISVEKSEKLHIAGRLDVDTTGLVLVTDDGKWSHSITSPKKECGKRYRAELTSPIEQSAVAQFAEGIQLNNERGLTRPAKLEIIEPYEVVVTVHEGKYHQVKRMFAAIGNKVVSLHRESIGGIELGDLPPGEWRYLTDEEAKL